jgi:hypothetical protein
MRVISDVGPPRVMQTAVHCTVCMDEGYVTPSLVYLLIGTGREIVNIALRLGEWSASNMWFVNSRRVLSQTLQYHTDIGTAASKW